MGDLIVMTRPTRPSPAILAAGGASADILFFTGVRYYPMPETPAVVAIDLAAPARRRSIKMKKPAAPKKVTLPRNLKRRVADHHF